MTMEQDRIPAPAFTLSAGPVDAYPDVLRALSRTVLYDYDPSFQDFYERLSRKAQAALRCAEPPVIQQGEPVLALEAAAASLIARDDVVLNLASGVYGKGFGYWAKRYCADLVEVEVPYDQAIDAADVEAAFRSRPDIRVVSVCHHDTPSGTINPIQEIGRITAAHGAFLIVDAVSSFGGMDIHPADCSADIFVTGPNKCLGCPPGLSLVAVSGRAWEKMKANPDAPRASFLSLLDWEHAWRRDRPFPFTPSVAELNGLDAALDLYLEEGPEAVWERHAMTAKACRAGVLAMGLELWPVAEAIASPTTTAVKVPAGADADALLDAARRIYGVSFSAGRAETKGKVLRVGHMGPTARPLYAVLALTALGGAVRACGLQADIGAGVEAAMAVISGARA
jgi:pyridoxamine---pyruvate transaminase